MSSHLSAPSPPRGPWERDPTLNPNVIVPYPAPGERPRTPRQLGTDGDDLLLDSTTRRIAQLSSSSRSFSHSLTGTGPGPLPTATTTTTTTTTNGRAKPRVPFPATSSPSRSPSRTDPPGLHVVTLGGRPHIRPESPTYAGTRHRHYRNQPPTPSSPPPATNLDVFRIGAPDRYLAHPESWHETISSSSSHLGQRSPSPTQRPTSAKAQPSSPTHRARPPQLPTAGTTISSAREREGAKGSTSSTRETREVKVSTAAESVGVGGGGRHDLGFLAAADTHEHQRQHVSASPYDATRGLVIPGPIYIGPAHTSKRFSHLARNKDGSSTSHLVELMPAALSYPAGYEGTALLAGEGSLHDNLDQSRSNFGQHTVNITGTGAWGIPTGTIAGTVAEEEMMMTNTTEAVELLRPSTSPGRREVRARQPPPKAMLARVGGDPHGNGVPSVLIVPRTGHVKSASDFYLRSLRRALDPEAPFTEARQLNVGLEARRHHAKKIEREAAAEARRWRQNNVFVMRGDDARELLAARPPTSGGRPRTAVAATATKTTMATLTSRHATTTRVHPHENHGDDGEELNQNQPEMVTAEEPRRDWSPIRGQQRPNNADRVTATGLRLLSSTAATSLDGTTKATGLLLGGQSRTVELPSSMEDEVPKPYYHTAAPAHAPKVYPPEVAALTGTLRARFLGGTLGRGVAQPRREMRQTRVADAMTTPMTTRTNTPLPAADLKRSREATPVMGGRDLRPPLSLSPPPSSPPVGATRRGAFDNVYPMSPATVAQALKEETEAKAEIAPAPTATKEKKEELHRKEVEVHMAAPRTFPVATPVGELAAPLTPGGGLDLPETPITLLSSSLSDINVVQEVGQDGPRGGEGSDVGSPILPVHVPTVTTFTTTAVGVETGVTTLQRKGDPDQDQGQDQDQVVRPERTMKRYPDDEMEVVEIPVSGVGATPWAGGTPRLPLTQVKPTLMGAGQISSTLTTVATKATRKMGAPRQARVESISSSSTSRPTSSRPQPATKMKGPGSRPSSRATTRATTRATSPRLSHPSRGVAAGWSEIMNRPDAKHDVVDAIFAPGSGGTVQVPHETVKTKTGIVASSEERTGRLPPTTATLLPAGLVAHLSRDEDLGRPPPRRPTTRTVDRTVDSAFRPVLEGRYGSARPEALARRSHVLGQPDPIPGYLATVAVDQPHVFVSPAPAPTPFGSLRSQSRPGTTSGVWVPKSGLREARTPVVTIGADTERPGTVPFDPSMHNNAGGGDSEFHPGGPWKDFEWPMPQVRGGDPAAALPPPPPAEGTIAPAPAPISGVLTYEIIPEVLPTDEGRSDVDDAEAEAEADDLPGMEALEAVEVSLTLEDSVEVTERPAVEGEGEGEVHSLTGSKEEVKEEEEEEEEKRELRVLAPEVRVDVPVAIVSGEVEDDDEEMDVAPDASMAHVEE